MACATKRWRCRWSHHASTRSTARSPQYRPTALRWNHGALSHVAFTHHYSPAWRQLAYAILRSLHTGFPSNRIRNFDSLRKLRMPVSPACSPPHWLLRTQCPNRVSPLHAIHRLSKARAMERGRLTGVGTCAAADGSGLTESEAPHFPLSPLAWERGQGVRGGVLRPHHKYQPLLERGWG